jgi:hypothetical protein
MKSAGTGRCLLLGLRAYVRRVWEPEAIGCGPVPFCRVGSRGESHSVTACSFSGSTPAMFACPDRAVARVQPVAHGNNQHALRAFRRLCNSTQKKKPHRLHLAFIKLNRWGVTRSTSPGCGNRGVGRALVCSIQRKKSPAYARLKPFAMLHAARRPWMVDVVQPRGSRKLRATTARSDPGDREPS